MTRQIRDRPDDWYNQARQELRLMELLDQVGPMTPRSIATQMELLIPEVWQMLIGLRMAECIRQNRKTGQFSLVPVEAPEQLGLEL